MQTDYASGRHPTWNKLIQQEISIDKNLNFASDMRVTLYRKSYNMLGMESPIPIGEFSVPVRSIAQFYTKP